MGKVRGMRDHSELTRSWTVQKLAYIYPNRFYFVVKDIDALSVRGRVIEHRFNSGSAWLLPVDLLRQLIFLLKARNQGVQHVVTHFAGYHTVLPTLLGFRTYIIVAGSDACSFPKINYGSFRKPWMRWAMAFSFRRAACILPVDPSLECFENTFSDFGPKQQGYAHFVQDLKTRSTAVPYGFDHGQWTTPESERTQRSCICVAFGAAYEDPVYFRKGIDLIIAAAQQLPTYQFTLIGLVNVEAFTGLPSNLRLLGRVEPRELNKLFGANSIVLQPSVMEGFPNALCEAMLCGCIPVVSNITSMPNIVEEIGIVIKERDVAVLVDAITSIENLSPEQRSALRRAARERIVPFTMERRTDRLMRAMDET